MAKYKKWKYLHPNNKLGQYIKLTKADNYIADFIDYIWFYWTYTRTERFYLFLSDNGREAYVNNISLIGESTASGRLLIYGLYNYQWHIVRLFRADEITMGKEKVLKIDFYGKWILLANRDNLRPTLEKIRRKFFWLEEVKITRTDYTCDCWKYNFRKENKLEAKVKGKITKDDNVEYYWFGRKGKARFIRYYDKKAEILARWTQWLYPDYFGYSQIMRYELQLNGDALDELDRYITIEQIKDYANFWHYIPDTTKHHKKRNTDALFEQTLANIKKMINNWEKDNIEKLKLFLETDFKIW